MKSLKVYGFSDNQIALSLTDRPTMLEVRALRLSLGVLPFVKLIDTTAAEFPAQTNYCYLTYQACEHDVDPMDMGTPTPSPASATRCPSPVRPVGGMQQSPELRTGSSDGMMVRRGNFELLRPLTRLNSAHLAMGSSIVVLGCGCYRIGSSVEFDWSATSCIKTLRALGHRALVVNCNPETVSTDYDESDRLYFEALDFETVLDIWSFEKPAGMIISVGGQAPNNLAIPLRDAGVRILGTSVESVDTAEDRDKFSKLCDSLNIDQPEWSAFTSYELALQFCRRVQFPVLVRPSYVLSGASMRVVLDDSELESFLRQASVISRDHPVVISKYIENAKEVEMDAVAGEGTILNYAISEHVENAGVHSGDATLILPAQKLYVETIRRVKKISQKIARALEISGPFNVQFMCRKNDVKVIECNLRASRTFPFISKTFNVNFVELATRAMVGAPYTSSQISLVDLEHVAVKAPMFSFPRLRGADPILGVEMRSTGEVACFGRDKHEALLKALLSTGFKIPQKNILLSTGPLQAKTEFLTYAHLLLDMGFRIFATKGTYEFLLSEAGTHDVDSENESPPNRKIVQDEKTERLDVVRIYKPLEDGQPNARDLISQGKVDMVINVPDSREQKSMTNGYRIRRAAIDCDVPLVTDLKLACQIVEALDRKRFREQQRKPFWEIRAWDEYMNERRW
eukprot:Polyplicarium_translucidae@DN2712_c0_g1_i3.p1